MRKIPTLFQRDPDDRRYVLPQVTPGCEWVLAGEGRPTQKFDGTCVMLDSDRRWWARRELKPGKAAPAGFVAVSTDEVTGKTVGWEPVEQSAFARWHGEALREAEDADVPARDKPFLPGTYELIGPKVNGNPERCEGHRLIAHATARTMPITDLSFDGIREAVLRWSADGVEGIVWHHEDSQRFVKIKARDFRSETAM
jgi:hypothetical protein